MDFNRLFKVTFDQYVKGIVKLILFTLVGCLLCFTIVLIPTVMGGLTRGMLRFVREGIEPEFDELWRFDDFLQILLLLVLGGITIAIGLALLIIPGLVLMVWWMYALFFIVDSGRGKGGGPHPSPPTPSRDASQPAKLAGSARDRKMTFLQAMGASRRLVTESGFWNHLVVLLVLTVLNSLGSGLAGLGTLLTAPFGLVLLTNAYLSSIREDVAPSRAAEPE